MSTPQWCFNGFRLDPACACLWRGPEAVPLPPKAFHVLHYLVTHPDRLVTKDELLDAAWPKTAVSDAVVRITIGTLRKALGDMARAPRCIATIYGRGYRFVAPVQMIDPVTPQGVSSVLSAPLPLLVPAPPPLLLEREGVLQRLHAGWAQARQGRRQILLVTGEAGIGKTAVVEAFATHVRREPTAALAYGQCVEHYGAGEVYLPVLEAVEQLCRGPTGESVVTLLRQHAPTWLVQLPWLLTATDRAQLQHELQGTTRERMLREFAVVVDTLTAETPLLLILEDLHWSDAATLDVLALLVRRRTAARLLVVGTYRPVAALGPPHPLRTAVQDMQRSGAVTELPLTGLSVEAVATYLAARFPQQRFPATLAPWLHQRTDGQPLFLVTLLQALAAQGVLHSYNGCWTVQEDLAILAHEVPESLRQALEQQITRLPLEAQRVLEVASVIGVEFGAAAVAAGLMATADMVEAYCDALVGLLLRPVGITTWPDGTVATRYAFVHALYQQVVYERLGAGRRVSLHRRLGEVLEGAYGPQAGEMAAELAEHFARGQDTQRAVHYLHQAAAKATQRYAHREVTHLGTRALALLRQLPVTPSRAQYELDLHMTLGAALVATRGHAAPEVQQTYARAHVLCHQVLENPQLPQTLVGLWLFHLGAGNHQSAQEVGRHLLWLAHRLDDPVARLYAHSTLGITALYLGEPAATRLHLEHGIALHDRLTPRPLTLGALWDIGVVCRLGAADALQQLGYPDQARQRGDEALALTQGIASPYNRCNLLLYLAFGHLFRREWRRAQPWVEEALSLATAHGFPLLTALGTLVRGATLTAQGQAQAGLAHLQQGLATCVPLGAKVLHPWGLAMLAEGYACLGQPEAGLTALAKAQALIATTREEFYAAEIARLEGELRLQAGAQAPAVGACTSPVTAVETCFQHALEIARRQQARWWELRAATSLSRLWQQQGRHAEAYELMAPIYDWFTEGFDTVDLQEARALLKELGS